MIVSKQEPEASILPFLFHWLRIERLLHDANHIHELIEEILVLKPGKIDKTATGLKKSDLVENKHGRIVSKKKSALGKKSPWLAAVKQARATLKIKGFLSLIHI